MRDKPSSAAPGRSPNPGSQLAAFASSIPDSWDGVLLPKWWSSLHSYLLLSALTVVCLLPFSGRAFHVDDTLFVRAAQQIVQHPLDPYGFKINWEAVAEPMADITKNPPLGSYYAALIATLVGWSERALHCGFMLAAIALVLGTYRLAKNFTRSPLLAALVTLLTPGVLVSACSVMCDTMMLAIWVWAAVFWIEGLNNGKTWFFGVSSLLITASALTKYFGVALIPLLLVYSIVRLRRVGGVVLWLSIPTAVLTWYQVWTAHLYGQGLLLGAAKFAASQRAVSSGSLAGMAVLGLSFAGGCCGLYGLIFAPFVWSRQQIAIAAVASWIASTAAIRGWLNLGPLLGGALSERPHLLIGSQLVLWIAGGISLFAFAIKEGWNRDADSLFLALWLLGTFIFAAFLNYTVNARSVLPLIPAAGILLARRMDKMKIASDRKRARYVALALAVSGSFALWIATGDSSLADSARTAATLIEEKMQGKGILWFEGHWGFQYYMESLGARPLDTDHPQSQAGDFVVIPFSNYNLVPPQFVASRKIFDVPLNTGATTISWEVGAGFYNTFWGPLPFAIGPVPPQRYMIVKLGASSSRTP